MKRALVSVSDKTGLVDFVRGLVDLGWEIIATGGTQKLLEKEGVKTAPCFASVSRNQRPVSV